MREPLLLPLAGLTAGILCDWAVPVDLPGLAAGFGTILLLAGFAAIRGFRGVAAFGFVSAALLAGAMRAEDEASVAKPFIEAYPYETVAVTGCVVEPPVTESGRQRFLVELEPAARAIVSVYYDEGEAPPELWYGDQVEIVGRLRKPRNFRNPGGFDYAGHLARKDIYWTVSASHPSGVTIQAGACGTPLWSFVYRTRRALSARLDTLYPNAAQPSGMLKAILLGESHFLEEDWKDDYRASGTYHTLVISGLHLSILARGLLWMFRLLGISLGCKVLLTIGVAWLYALLTGCNTPVLRATAGLSLFLTATWFFRGKRLLNILAAVGIVLLMIDPEQLYEPGVHLSFLAVAMIGGFAVPLLEKTTLPYARGLAGLHEASRDLHLPAKVSSFRLDLRLVAETVSLVSRIPERMVSGILSAALRLGLFFVELALVSAVIQIGLLLPMLVYFQQFPVAGFLANPLVVSITMLLLPTGMLAIATGWPLAAQLAGQLSETALRSASWFSETLNSLSVPVPPIWLAAGYAGGLLIATVCLRIQSRIRWVGALPIAVLGPMMLIHPFPPRVDPGWLEHSAIDVGQAESLLAVMPDGTTMLIDGGGIPGWKGQTASFDTGEDVVAPYLHSRSIRNLDIVVSTHGHEDHIRGLYYLLQEFHPSELWTGAGTHDRNTVGLRCLARSLGVRVVELYAGTRRELGNVGVEVLAPFASIGAWWEANNDQSVTLRLTYGDHSFLLTGDMEHVLEQRLLPRLSPTTVLKVAHHGSQTSTSSALLAALRPSYALISTGEGNPYRLPHYSVIQRMRDAKVEILRTDTDGLSSIRSNGVVLLTHTIQ